MNDDADDLHAIDLDARPPTPRRSRRARRSTVVMVAAGVLLLGVGTLVASVLHKDSSHSTTSDTVVLPPVPSSSPTTTADHLVASPDAEFVGQIGLISPGVGWALNGLALYRTSDDGAHWHDITPPGTVDPIARIDALDFLDADHAWVAVLTNTRPFTIWRTADAGVSWQPIVPSLCGTRSVLSTPVCGSLASIDFIDPQHGWALFSVPRSRATLLATSDGGTTWTVVSRTPFSGPLHFVDSVDGWATTATTFDPSGAIDRAGGALYRTRDGGKTWNPVTLPTREGVGSLPLAIGAPQFIGRNDAVVARLVLRPANVRAIVVYETHDDGRTWSTHATPSTIRVRFTELAGYRFAAASPVDWTLLVGTHLYTTHDAGQHWSIIVPTRTRLVEIAVAESVPVFTWVLACDSEPPDGCANRLLFHTADGGVRWRVGSPMIGITANRLP